MSTMLSDTWRPASKAGFPACEAELVAAGSLEMSLEAIGEIPEMAALLPTGTRVFVNHSPRHALADALPALARLHKLGLDPVPHIAARRVPSHAAVHAFLKNAVTDCGVTKDDFEMVEL